MWHQILAKQFWPQWSSKRFTARLWIAVHNFSIKFSKGVLACLWSIISHHVPHLVPIVLVLQVTATCSQTQRSMEQFVNNPPITAGCRCPFSEPQHFMACNTRHKRRLPLCMWLLVVMQIRIDLVALCSKMMTNGGPYQVIIRFSLPYHPIHAVWWLPQERNMFMKLPDPANSIAAKELVLLIALHQNFCRSITTQNLSAARLFYLNGNQNGLSTTAREGEGTGGPCSKHRSHHRHHFWWRKSKVVWNHMKFCEVGRSQFSSQVIKETWSSCCHAHWNKKCNCFFYEGHNVGGRIRHRGNVFPPRQKIASVMAKSAGSASAMLQQTTMKPFRQNIQISSQPHQLMTLLRYDTACSVLPKTCCLRNTASSQSNKPWWPPKDGAAAIPFIKFSCTKSTQFLFQKDMYFPC